MRAAPAQIFAQLRKILDRLAVPYMVVGSIASSIYGQVRVSWSIDLVASLRRYNIEPLVERLQPEFYIAEDEIRTALEHDRPFNVIHLSSGFKFDIFPGGQNRYQQLALGRRREETSPLGEFPVASPEDVILGKLRWFRMGGEVSPQQWNDVLGVIAMQREHLDYEYLREWAAYLKITDLLDGILAERHEQL